MADAYNTSTSHADYIATKVAEQTVLTFTDWTANGFLAVASNISDQIPMGANKIQVPVHPGVTLAAHTQGTPEEYSQISSSNVSLTINTFKAVVPAITFEASAFANQNIFEIMGMQIGKNAAKNLDASLAALYSSAGLTVTGTTGANISEANVRSAKQQMDEANAPRGRFLVVNPQQMDALSAIQRFSEPQSYGGNGEPIREGVVGRIHGFDVYVSNNVVEDTAGFAHCLAGTYGSGMTEDTLQWAAIRYQPLVSANPMRDIPAAGLRLTFDLDNKAGAESVRGSQGYGVATFRSEWMVNIKVAN